MDERQEDAEQRGGSEEAVRESEEGAQSPAGSADREECCVVHEREDLAVEEVHQVADGLGVCAALLTFSEIPIGSRFRDRAYRQAIDGPQQAGTGLRPQGHEGDRRQALGVARSASAIGRGLGRHGRLGVVGRLGLVDVVAARLGQRARPVSP
ncbi:hypothetical protein ACGFYP_01515 [Streptomyces sp. NPDC048370]|uniref:hypothetical protein n=1 Tax=Streptomyces sp. NPDC048370 TaxID=3365540 RepID=UPI00371D61A1